MKSAIQPTLQRWFPFLQDDAYLEALKSIAVPIILQQAIASVLNAVDVLMLGQLGETSVAAVGLANQLGFLMMFVLFGTTSGAAAFISQYWGKRDIPSIRRVLGIGMSICLLASVAFLVFVQISPATALHIYTSDPQVIETGIPYLRLISLTYPLTAISFCFGMVHRSTGWVRLPTTTGIIAILIKSGLSLVLIFGWLGFPRLGVPGAAIATLIARALETTILVFFTYWKRLPAAASVKEMYDFNFSYLKAVLEVAFPVILNESLWSLGISTYNAIYARIGTQSIAAYNIATTIEGMAFVLFIGVTDATAIMIGNRLGAGERETAYRYGGWSLRLNLMGGLLVGGLIILASFFVPSLYNISPEAKLYARNLLIIMGACVWIRTSNMVLVVGVLRSGGDTRVGALLDVGTLWAIGVPSALLAAFVFKLEIYWVYLLVMSEELVKLLIGYWRYRSRRWMHDLTVIQKEPHPTLVPVEEILNEAE